jgi:hypothetical protein
MFDTVINMIKAVFNNEGLKQEEEKPKADLRAMTKKQLEEHGRSLGIKLNRKHSKKKLIETIENASV